MILILICSIIVAIFMYLIIIGGSMNKTDKEKELEDKEQMKY